MDIKVETHIEQDGKKIYKLYILEREFDSISELSNYISNKCESNNKIITAINHPVVQSALGIEKKTKQE